MAIFSVYVVNKAGGLIYQLDSYAPRAEAEKTFSYPLDLLLKLHDERVLVAFGQRDGIRGWLDSGRGLVLRQLAGRRGVGAGSLFPLRHPKNGISFTFALPLQWATQCWPLMAWT